MLISKEKSVIVLSSGLFQFHVTEKSIQIGWSKTNLLMLMTEKFQL